MGDDVPESVGADFDDKRNPTDTDAHCLQETAKLVQADVDTEHAGQRPVVVDWRCTGDPGHRRHAAKPEERVDARPGLLTGLAGIEIPRPLSNVGAISVEVHAGG